MHEFFFSKLDKSPKYGKWISSIPVICVWMFLIFLTSLFFIFPCPELSHDYILIPIIQGIITLYTVANLFLATFLDPGALPKESIEVSDTQPPHYQHTEINGVTVRMKWCATCHFYRPPRTSHCAVCDHCVEMFDHHCPLINNCVGKRNYRCFFTFLTFLCIHMITIFNFNIMYLLRQRSNLLHGGAIVTIILNTAIVFLFIPFLKLFCFHVYLVSGGRTTKEWCDGKFHNSNNPFSKGWKMNIYSRLCGTQYPRLKRGKATYCCSCFGFI